MNQKITTRFDHYLQLLIETPVIVHFTVLKRNITRKDGRIRVKAILIDGELLEFAEYLAFDEVEQIATYTYSFHWQDRQKQLVRRWDNTKHFPKLPYAPHHIHQGDGTVTGNPTVPSLETVLAEIEQALLKADP